ncbi:MAG: Asp-tRNA(Asn)/Glu-tRNA(Gln) amidotransferase subunit GatA [Kiritimatiellae bacterium]|nr:Asp-tRNA(Asn)/Glu-tRNA(Gln) amidotransferase subunit GatA [Kiritimatiellia bacterium]
MNAPAAWTLAETRARLAARDVSAREVVESVLEAIERRNGELNAYISVDADAALAAAHEADERRSRGDSAPLLGVPIGVKDNIAVRDAPCTCASRMLANYRSPYDSTVAARLRATGAILLGRLNLDEFAMGSSTETSAFGPVRNPWDPERVAGGSSGGSAAAVAANLAIAALGSDTGGSIRQPASFCGCVGLKPTYGRVSRYGLVAYASSLDQIGPITKTVLDAAILLDAIAGRDPRDSTTLEVPPPGCERALETASQDLRGVRIGIPGEYFIGGLDAEVERLVRGAITRAGALGAEIVAVSLPHTRHAIASYYLIATAEASANLARYDGVRYGLRVSAEGVTEMYARTRGAGFGLEVRRRIILGTHALSAGYYDQYYLRAQKVRTLIRRDFAAAFERCDVIAGPVAPTPAFRLGENLDDPLKMYLSDVYTVPVNLAGVCAVSVPAGRTSAGLPVGLQLIGPAMGEASLLRVARALERERETPP